ncbi:amidohydrolase family protein [Paraburkholderia sediminicola]|uniref:amidohydrolase family protein n=1 Tax=Paraburkholderia sediminicola TaxID=458836 RepID=UPI0038B724B9
MKVDVHAHFVDRTYLNELTRLHGLRAIPGAAGQTLLRKGDTTFTWFRDSFFDLDGRLRDMDRYGIDIRILSLSTPSVYDWPVITQVLMARFVNDSLAKICAAHPDRFLGLATLPLADTGAAIEEMDRCLDELGFRGIAIGSNIGGKPLNHPDLEEFWAEVDRRQVPVVEHPMYPVGASDLNEFELPLRVGFIYDTTTAATRMIYGGVFERYPNFPFILAHTGAALLMVLERLDNGYRIFPDCRQHISQLPSVYARRLYYDTCSFSGPALMLAREIVGADHLLFGTDDPFISANSDHVDQLPIPSVEKSMILAGNAARLFGIDLR